MSKKQNQYKFGRQGYIIKNKLGIGSTGEVYEGIKLKKKLNLFQDETQKKYALKFISKTNLQNPSQNKMLNNQIRTLKQLNGLNQIISLYEVFQTEKHTCIVLQLCQNENLRELVKKGPIQQYKALIIMKQIVSGFLKLVENKIIHRDIKPSNILFDKEGKVKIADFGCAIFENQLKKEGQNKVGSKFYMAPQIKKDNLYSYKTDVWAIGVTFYQLLFGRRPWSQKNQKKLLKLFQSVPIEKLIPSQISQDGKQFLIKTIEPNVELRANPEDLLPLIENMINNKKGLKEKEFSQRCGQLNSVIQICRLKFSLLDIIDNEKSNIFKNILKPSKIKKLKSYIYENIENIFYQIQTLQYLNQQQRSQFKHTDHYQNIKNTISFYKKNFFLSQQKQKTFNQNIINQVLLQINKKIKSKNSYLLFIFYHYLITMKSLDDYFKKQGIKQFHKNVKIYQINQTLKTEIQSKIKKITNQEHLIKLQHKLRGLFVLK